jgi:hypothetical protein
MEIRILRKNELEEARELNRYAFNTSARHREPFLRWDPSRLVGSWACQAEQVLDRGTAEDRAALDGAFVGPVPWMLDEF